MFMLRPMFEADRVGFARPDLLVREAVIEYMTLTGVVTDF